MQQHDPYPQIKLEIERELQQVAALQAAVFSGRTSAAVQLQQALHDVADQLTALEGAVARMVAKPAQYNLMPTTAYVRQVEVETLKFQLGEFQATCAHLQTNTGAAASTLPTSSSQYSGATTMLPTSKEGDPGSHQQWGSAAGTSVTATSSSSGWDVAPRLAAPPSATTSNSRRSSNNRSAARHSLKYESNADLTAVADGAQGGWDSYAVVMDQQKAQQDETLEHISFQVERIRDTGQAMHDELEEQALLLDGVQQDTDTSQLQLRALTKRVGHVIKSSGQTKQLCTIILLSVVLVVVAIFALS